MGEVAFLPFSSLGVDIVRREEGEQGRPGLRESGPSPQAWPGLGSLLSLVAVFFCKREVREGILRGFYSSEIL